MQGVRVIAAVTARIDDLNAKEGVRTIRSEDMSSSFQGVERTVENMFFNRFWSWFW